MAYKNKKEYKKDKRAWNNNRMQARNPAGYSEFKVREAAWLQLQALKDDDDDDKKESKPKDSGKADRSSGKYSDIVKAQEEDRDKGNRVRDKFKNKQPKVGGISKKVQKQLDRLTLANSNLSDRLKNNSKKNKKTQAKNAKAYEKQLKKLTLTSNNYKKQLDKMAKGAKGSSNKQSKNKPKDPAATYKKDLETVQADYTQQIADMQTKNSAALLALQNENQTALAQMQALMLTQQEQATNTQELLKSQLSTANTALTEQKRVAKNLEKAYVPQAEATADTVVYGDMREQQRKRRNNQLSDLSIVTGVGNNGNNGLSGLQLAG